MPAGSSTVVQFTALFHGVQAWPCLAGSAPMQTLSLEGLPSTTSLVGCCGTEQLARSLGTTQAWLCRLLVHAGLRHPVVWHTAVHPGFHNTCLVHAAFVA